MKKLFYFGLLGLAIFEILKVYFIMPMPGSQQMDSVDFAYFLHSFRSPIRSVFGLMIVAGLPWAFKTKRKWVPAVAMIPVIVIIYFFNFKMTADHMFLQPATLAFKSKSENVLNDSSVVIAVNHQGLSKAYPVRYIVYHHQVRDTIGDKPIMVTYCSVCRTGRVFEPTVDGKPENFRLVGMDHFNAMFEDETTKSWWQQSTGQAITGSLKGRTLPEVESSQLTLGKFFSLNPFGKVMQAEDISRESYDSVGRFEKGRSRGKLTRTDSLSWKDKSWVVGVQIGENEKAYDWLDLKKVKVINDQIGRTPIAIALSSDEQSFAVFERSADETFTIRNDSLFSANGSYDFAGRTASGPSLKGVRAYQEFWHSWKTFHPKTETYSLKE
jgi:hypothetical protein